MNIEVLIQKYSKLIYKICFDMLKDSQDAEDITQEVFLSYYISRFKYSDLNENETKNLICKIALNKCKDIFKSKQNKIRKITDNNIEDLENYEDTFEIENEILQKEYKEDILRVIDDLKYPYNEVIKYYYIEEFSLDEVSRILDIPKTTLKMQIYRAKAILKNNININEGGDLLCTEKK